jgi:hypothetical protein
MQGKLKKFVLWHPSLGFIYKQPRGFKGTDSPETRGMFTREKDVWNIIKGKHSQLNIKSMLGDDGTADLFEVFEVDVVWRIKNDGPLK